MTRNLIIGAPCSGKSTHAQQLNPQQNPILIDMDQLLKAISPHTPTREYPPHHVEAARAARRTLTIAALRSNQPLTVVDCAFTNPTALITRWITRHHATVTWTQATQYTCHQRATEQRDPFTHQLIDRWFNQVLPQIQRHPLRHRIKEPS